jgi:glutaminase
VTKIADVLEQVATEIAAKAETIETSKDAKEPGLEPGPLGLAVALPDGSVLSAGEAGTGFPIQSISKVFALSLALEDMDDRLFERVGREPSGDPFNSIVELERTGGLPRNPFINAGALVVSDAVLDCRGEDATVRFVREAAKEPDAPLDKEVLASETEGGDLNRAILSFMRHHDNLRGTVDDVLRSYVRQCALRLDCMGLARAGLYLTDANRRPGDDAQSRIARDRRRVLSLMTTCGHYDGSGDFAMRVGLPAKSGVGGGILAIVPGIASVAAWSPNLDQSGNSMQAFRALEMLCDLMDWSLFDG